MARRTVLALIALALAPACHRGPDPEALERQYNLMKANGDPSAELCRKAGEVASAWLARENQGQYQIWHLTEDVDCNEAVLDRM